LRTQLHAGQWTSDRRVRNREPQKQLRAALACAR
jgi:hypothetical protein